MHLSVAKDNCCARSKAAASGDEMLSFLKGLMEGVPDLGDDEEAAPAEPKARKRRCELPTSASIARHSADCQVVGFPYLQLLPKLHKGGEQCTLQRLLHQWQIQSAGCVFSLA